MTKGPPIDQSLAASSTNHQRGHNVTPTLWAGANSYKRVLADATPEVAAYSSTPFFDRPWTVGRADSNLRGCGVSKGLIL